MKNYGFGSYVCLLLTRTFEEFIMGVTTSTRSVTTSQTFLKPFEFLGNVGTAKVQKFKSYLGDGDIHTGDGGQVLVSVRANLVMQTAYSVRLKLRYDVWESSYNASATSGKKDRLFFEAYQDFDLRQFLQDGIENKTVGNTTTKTVASSLALSACNEAYYIDYYKTKDSRHGWYPIDPNSYPAQNIAQSWIPLSSIKVKIDGSGSELTGKGNIGISGNIRFVVRRTDTIQTTVVTDDVVSGSAMQRTFGSGSVLNGIEQNTTCILGHGYDICDRYANNNSCRGVVLDVNALNQYKRVLLDTNRNTYAMTNSGEGVDEYSKSIEKKLSVKASASAFGASFSNETKTSFKEESYTKEGYKMLTMRDIFAYKTYKIDGYAAAQKQLTSFVTPKFLSDLDTMNADQFVQAYGTHVILGMVLGARFNYNYSYKESVTKKSQSRSFESSTSVSYNPLGKIEPPKNEGKKSQAEQIFDKLMSAKTLDAKLLEAYTKFLESIKSGSAPKQDAKGNTTPATGGNGASISSSYSESTSTNAYNETKSTEINASGCGGSLMALNKAIHDLTKYDAWVDTIESNDFVFADFVPGTIVPIYEFVPSGHRLSANAVKTASEAYQIRCGMKTIECGRSTLSTTFDTNGKNNSSKIHEDWEVSSHTGKLTGWRFNAELVNFENGEVGAAIALNVYEGGLDANRTILQSHLTKVLPLGACSAMAIDTDKTIRTFTAEGNISGQHHEWIDVTNYFANCKFIDTYANRVYVKLDGKGDDGGNIGVKGVLKVPVIKFQ